MWNITWKLWTIENWRTSSPCAEFRMQMTWKKFCSAPASEGALWKGPVRFQEVSSEVPDPPPPDREYTKNQPRRPVQAIRTTSGSEGEQDSISSRSEREGYLRRIYARPTKVHTGRTRNVDGPRYHQDPNPDRGQRALEGLGKRADSEASLMKCTHCGSKKHGDLDFWKRIVCERCGKKGHPADHCLFVCRGCNEVHDVVKCQMEAFYKSICQWYSPNKHVVQLSEAADKMLNLDARQVNNTRANLLFNSGAEVSSLDIAFDRKVKITLNGVLVYFSTYGSLVGQDAFLGMDIMLPAVIRLDMVDEYICLPDEVRIQLAGRKTLYNGHISEVKLVYYVNMSVS
ncbi:unnamed protein product [Peronospora effusa]|nr:unnamed protein product [Peronospora effusa]